MTFRRPPRREPPPLVIKQVDVRPPPAMQERTPAGASGWLMVLPALGGLGAMALVFAAGGGGTHIAAGVMFGVSALAMAGGGLARLGGDRNRRVAGDRRDYHRHLARIRRDARAAATSQAESLFWVHPDPQGLVSLVRTTRLWERRPGDPDFATLRLGVGDHPLAMDLRLDDPTPDEKVDLLSAAALRRFLRAHATVRMVPVAVALRAFGRVRLEGEPVARRRLAAAMVLQAITWHAPTEFRIALCVDQIGVDAWDWLKWAPHLAVRTGSSPARYSVAADLTALEELLADDLAGRPWASTDSDPPLDRGHLLVIIDGGSVAESGQLADPNGLLGVTLLDLTGALPDETPARSLRLRVASGAVLSVSLDRLGREMLSTVGVPDAIGPATAAATSRSIAATVMADEVGHDEPAVWANAMSERLGSADVSALDPESAWRTRPPRDRLRVAIGVGTAGQPVELDLKEAAQGGMGPHGLVVGATGSGKSELLRTLVLGLAMTHSPASLNFVLIDFKGGATFTRLDALPHTSAVITNLSDEITLIDRMKDAISGELHRRMEALRNAGHFASLRDYENARFTGDLSAGNGALPEIPTLLIVVDEFSELLTAKPEFLDLFITIGRVGRSLGVHLLLASQRLEEGRLRGLDTHLSYRVGLKTFSVAESRIVLGVPDAFELPTAPGNGYLKFDTGSLLRFTSAYVSGPMRQDTSPRLGPTWLDAKPFRLSGSPDSHRGTTAPGVKPGSSAGSGRVVGGIAGVGQPGIDSTRAACATTAVAVESFSRVRGHVDGLQPERAPSMLDVAVSRLSGAGSPAHRVWLPPLFEPPSLDLLLAGTESNRPLGSTATRLHRTGKSGEIAALPTTFGSPWAESTADVGSAAQAALRVPLGWVDRPFEQCRGLLTLDLSGSGGNVAIVGAPQTGKSTAVRSLICALALTQSPEQVQVYCLDFGGGSLTTLSGLPHVGAIAGRSQPDLVRRTVGMVHRAMTAREQLFAAHGIGSTLEWRERIKSGRLRGDGFGEVFLVVDGWAGVRESFEPLESQITSMAARGLNFGVHLVLSATRWSEIRPALKDLVSSRVELRLGDPLDSDINSKAAASVPVDRPGRGLTRDQHHLLTAVPRVDGTTGVDGLPGATADLVRSVAERWADHTAPKVRLLPTAIPAADLPAFDAGRGYPLGLDEDFEPVYWNPRGDQHLLIFGQEESGKTTLVANLLRQIAARTRPDQARFIVFDSRRQLLELGYRTDQLIASATTAKDAANVVSANLDRLLRRLPAPTASPQEIARRTWWGSPADIFLVVDDYEKFAGSSPLLPLLPLLDNADDIGLHLIIARQARGASRALYDGLLARLRDSGSPAVVLSGPESEGVIYGNARAQSKPPGRGVWVPRRGADLIFQVATDCGITDGT